MKSEVIHAGKVILRPKKIEDAADDYQWRCDPELAELDATSPLRQSFEDYVRFYQEELRYPSPWSVRWGIDSTEGIHIGNCMCYDINTTSAEAEIGIMIGNKDYWSRSYGYDCMAGLIDFMFRSTDMQRLYLHTLTWNHRAQRCFEKCGMTPVKTVKRFNRELLNMELHRETWLQIRDEKLVSLKANQNDPNSPH